MTELYGLLINDHYQDHRFFRQFKPDFQNHRSLHLGMSLRHFVLMHSVGGKNSM